MPKKPAFIPPGRPRLTARRAVLIVGLLVVTVLVSAAVTRWLDRMNPDRRCRSADDCWIAN